MISIKDIDYMQMAFEESLKSNDHKNIGCVIVKNNIVISTGHRMTFIINQNPLIDITFHAEHIALLIAGENAKGATLYTTLEPCTKRCCTPGDNTISCSDLIIQYGIARVMIASLDEDFGKGGIKKLMDAGIKTDKL